MHLGGIMPQKSDEGPSARTAEAVKPQGPVGRVEASSTGDGNERLGSSDLGFEPRGVAVAPDGKTAYVALTTAGAVAVIDLARLEVTERIPVGRWPRYLALSPDGKQLAVGVSGDGGVGVIDITARKTLYVEDFVGLNLGQMQVSADGKYGLAWGKIDEHFTLTDGLDFDLSNRWTTPATGSSPMTGRACCGSGTHGRAVNS